MLRHVGNVPKAHVLSFDEQIALQQRRVYLGSVLFIR
jgi:hypothetical protein